MSQIREDAARNSARNAGATVESFGRALGEGLVSGAMGILGPVVEGVEEFGGILGEAVERALEEQLLDEDDPEDLEVDATILDADDIARDKRRSR